jgi:iron complex transport system substrate-binding protein
MTITFRVPKVIFILFILSIVSCKSEKKETLPVEKPIIQAVNYAKGFAIEKLGSGVTILKITSPWPNAESAFTYALVPKDKQATITLNKDAYNAIVSVPVERLVVTSTTHIPALEALEVLDKLVGFPDTKYVSSEKTRRRIDSGSIKELGNNESINTEMLIELNPEVVVGFGISNENSIYETIQRANIPVVYNGDWTEETPLRKAEWIKFFAPFFQKEALADSIFSNIQRSYDEAKDLAKTANTRPTVISGAMYKDVWYLPGGKSWAAQFLQDANADYLWKDTSETGSLSLSWEKVLEKGQQADFWIGPAQFIDYQNMQETSEHYAQFDAFKNKQVFTFANTKGATGGLLYYELAPQRPDLVLKDLIHILHPELLPKHQPFFFKPLN